MLILPYTIIIESEQTQNGLGHLATIVLEMRRLLGAVSVLLVLDAARLLAHGNLAFDHVLVEAHVRLTREQAVGDVQALDGGVLAPAPALDVDIVRQQAAGRCGGGHALDLVLVHLVQMDLVGRGAEEALARLVEVDRRVAKLPVTLGGVSQFAAEETSEQLMAEADAGEIEVCLFVLPQFWSKC